MKTAEALVSDANPWLDPVVVRRLDHQRAALSVDARLEALAGARLPLDHAVLEVSRAERERTGWRTHGRLIFRGRGLVRFARVHADVVRWSDSESELIIRPRSRWVRTWGRRRADRYFSAVHEAADALAGALVAATVVTLAPAARGLVGSPAA